MDLDELKGTLKSLHEELALETEVDQELKDLLTTLDEDIQQLVEPAAAPEGEGGVLEQAESLAARFAAAHPRLESMMQEVVAALAKMGV